MARFVSEANMAELRFELSVAEKADALEVAAAQAGRPTHLVEKDIWVVWTLAAIYNSQMGNTLTFKGGTSLSKV
jgi:predicted nucleotidyltransferase component of viral defense system